MRKCRARLALVVKTKSWMGCKTRLLSFNDMIRISFGRNCNKSALAEQYEVSRQTVGRMWCVCSRTLLEMQLHQLTEFAEHCELHRPDFAIAVVMWDETGQSLTLDAVPGALRHQQSSTWQVAVSQIRPSTQISLEAHRGNQGGNKGGQPLRPHNPQFNKFRRRLRNQHEKRRRTSPSGASGTEFKAVVGPAVPSFVS